MKKTRKLTFAAVCTALTILLFFLGMLIKTGTAAIFFLTTLLSMILITETDRGYGTLSYVAAGLLLYFLLPQKEMVISYIAFVGIYAVIKSLAEQIKNRGLEWVVKIAFINLSIGAAYLLFRLLVGEVALKLPLWILWPAGNLILIGYDLLLTFGIGYYNRNLAKRIHNGAK